METSKPFALLIVALVFATGIASAAPTIAVYKNEGCGCCDLWIQRLEKSGLS